MVKEFGDYMETLPKEWKKKYPNEHLQEIMADPALWFLCPSPNSSNGKKILKRNDPLFQFCMKLDDFEYAIEPVDGFLFELVPGNVMRQGIGISTNTDLDMLEVDLYFFPCDYTANPKRKLGVHALRVPVFSTRNTDIIDGIVRTFFREVKNLLSFRFQMNASQNWKEILLTIIKRYLPSVEKRFPKAQNRRRKTAGNFWISSVSSVWRNKEFRSLHSMKQHDKAHHCQGETWKSLLNV